MQGVTNAVGRAGKISHHSLLLFSLIHSIAGSGHFSTYISNPYFLSPPLRQQQMITQMENFGSVCLGVYEHLYPIYRLAFQRIDITGT